MKIPDDRTITGTKVSDVPPHLPFQAIIAAAESDHAELDRLIAAMLPSERLKLALAAQRLMESLRRTGAS